MYGFVKLKELLDSGNVVEVNTLCRQFNPNHIGI